MHAERTAATGETSFLDILYQRFPDSAWNKTVVIKEDGNLLKQLALKNDTEFDVSGYQGGTNHIVIQDNAVYMPDADCPDKLCVHTGTIHKTGETIVCLPHRVVVEITGTTDTFDAVVQ